MLQPHVSPLLKATPHIAHGFFNRHGGVSQGIYDSLNGGPGSHDASENVVENRRRLQSYFSAERIYALYQCHSNRVITIDQHNDTNNIGNERADGMVTNLPRRALVILTADCAPLLLADRRQKIIGACHAGWRGAVAGVIENTVSGMNNLGSRTADITAAIGPLIGPRSYQVRGDMKKAATDQNPLAEQFFTAIGNDQFLFDLSGFCGALLTRLGVGQHGWIGKDTYADHGFFSHRRNHQQGIDDYGRLLSCIMLRGD